MNFLFNVRYLGCIGLLVMALALLAPGLHGQYFGRNKVQYEKFDFKVMSTEHFDVFFYPENREAAELAARLAERWNARLSRILNHELKGRQPLILYSSQPHFQQTTAIPGVLGEGTGGVTEVFKRRIVLPFGASLAETDHVIGHELVHAFQFDLTSQGRGPVSGAGPTALRLPLWFIEGLAEYLSIGPVDPHTAMWMRDATHRNEVPPVKKLESYRYFPYRYGHALWAYFTGRWGDETVARLMKGVGRVGDLEASLERILGIPLKTLSENWIESLKEAYTPVLEMTEVKDASSRVLVKGTEMNVLNVSPSLSPDGKEVIFLSTRELFSVDLFLADMDTGKIKQKITTTAIDPHFESLQFIRSAGSWDPEGRLFLFGAVSKGQPILSIYNVHERTTEKEIAFPEIGEILNPAWSPDGRFIVFSAVVGGFTDLFIYELETDVLRRMTEDAYSDLQPAWSPDGRFIAFVTDRFSTDLSILSIGNYEIALLDPDSGKIERVPVFVHGKNINPQWSPDSKSLFFLSDQNGKTDIYRIDLAAKTIYQVTNLYTGVSGLTALSPALSVAHQAERLVYSAYDEGRYSLFAMDSSEAIRGNPELARFGDLHLSVLPPRKKPEGMLLGLLKNPLFGLPKEKSFPVADYKPKLSLDYISPPQLAVGVDRYGTYGGGGMTLFWSDMLGYHTLATMGIVSTRLIDSALLVGYLNNLRRWNWGLVAQRIPYVTGSYAYGYGNIYGEPAFIEREILFRQINYDLAGLVSYPFSQVRRFELSAGFRYLDFDQEIITRAYSLYGNIKIYDDKEKLPAPPGISFAYLSAALVYDSSFFGATSPILGQSYILEFSPTMGNLTFSSLLADYRRYLMPVRPFTLAFRCLHYGRYGRDAEDDRLWPLFLGYENLVRGYNLGSFEAAEFESGAAGFPFERLFGSKMIVANVELRFPLFRILGLGRGYYGVLPMEFYGFYDVGLAWEDEDRAWFLGGERKPFSSTGVGLRMNVMGYLVAGVNLVKPLDRPHKGWYFQFTIMPGF